jgi:hypothetical protein
MHCSIGSVYWPVWEPLKLLFTTRTETAMRSAPATSSRPRCADHGDTVNMARRRGAEEIQRVLEQHRAGEREGRENRSWETQDLAQGPRCRR